uniref:Uncharacterized protein n=1 Tax=Mycena chlorophos TaxID=658473 RepID=A0ABQ0LX48_MYCCL|nr:predicted protein [Mycena chlorophos]
MVSLSSTSTSIEVDLYNGQKDIVYGIPTLRRMGKARRQVMDLEPPDVGAELRLRNNESRDGDREVNGARRTQSRCSPDTRLERCCPDSLSRKVKDFCIAGKGSVPGAFAFLPEAGRSDIFELPGEPETSDYLASESLHTPVQARHWQRTREHVNDDRAP